MSSDKEKLIPDQCSDQMIEELLEESMVEAPEDITSNVVQALPPIRRSRSPFETGVIPRRKVMTWTVSILMMIIIMMIAFMIMTMRIMNRRIRQNLNPRPVEAVENTPQSSEKPQAPDLQGFLIATPNNPSP